jgi:PPM family protein phosphatase
MAKLVSAGATHIGLVRINNEDAYLAMPEAGLFALSDGMGGAAAGEVASRYFVEAVEQIFTEGVSASEEANAALVQKVFKYSNKRITEHTVKHPGDEGMGCTGDLLVVQEKSYVIGHVGDSRVYLLRKESLRQVTRDHSLVQGLVDEGILTPEEARHHPRKNIILQAIGTDPLVVPDIIKGEAFNHDIFLLCSDGLTDMVDDLAIRDALVSKKTLDDKAESLISAALAAGGKDNVTVVLCQIKD